MGQRINYQILEENLDCGDMWPVGGVREKDMILASRSERVSEEQRRALGEWTRWRASVAHTKNKNRLALWSLVRMAAIFDESEDTAGEAETVRQFIASQWDLNGEDVEWILAGNRHNRVAEVLK